MTAPSQPTPILQEAPQAPPPAPQRRDETAAAVSVSRLGVKVENHRSKAPLPGVLRTTGTDPRGPDCGAYKSGASCKGWDPDEARRGQKANDRHDRWVTRFSCNNQSCEEPACRRKWVNRRAPAAAARVIGATYWHEGVHADPIHVTFSPPPWFWSLLWDAFELNTEDTMNKARKDVRKMAKKVGLKGGALVFHPHRCKYQNDARGRYDASPLKWSPHFHVVGGGWIKGVERNHEETGWVVVNHGVRQDTQGTIAYLMDHCAWVSGKQAVSYFGTATPHYTRVEELERSKEPTLSDCCNESVVTHPADDEGVDWETIDGEHYSTVRRFLVTATKRKDKFPLEFTTKMSDFSYRMVKPPPDSRPTAEQIRLGVEYPMAHGRQ